MKKETNSEVKSDVMTGMGSAVGATVGMMAGSALATEAQAAEVEQPEVPEKHDAPIKTEVHDENVVVVQTTPDKPASEPEKPTTEPEKPTTEPEKPTTEPEKPTTEPEKPTPEPEPVEPEVEVLSLETVVNGDGSLMDVALLSVDGVQTVVADVDMDGVADVIAVDANSNGQLDDGELVDVSNQGIIMDSFQSGVGIDDPSLASMEQDYVNDADVQDFMA